MSTDSITIDTDRYRDMTALASRVDTLLADARDAKHDAMTARRDRDAAIAERDAARKEASRLLARLDEVKTPPDAQALRAEAGKLRAQIARYRLLGAAAARIEADLATLRGAFREDGGLQ